MALKSKSKPKPKPRAGSAPSARKVTVQGVTPFLWFNRDAEAAARFYVSLFNGSKVTRADAMAVEFTLAGQPFYALNGGPSYTLTPAYSMFVTVKTQADVDRLWDSLCEGGEPSRCGWLVDKFGLSWQIIPTRLPELLGHRDPAIAQRAMQAMLKMGKIDIRALERSALGK